MAARFWIGGGTNTNWNASPTTNWSLTSGGVVRVAAPTVSDDVTFDGAGAGNSASIVSATNSCLSLTFTSGYTNTLTLNAVLTIAGNFTDNTAHSWAGASTLTISAASTITSGGKTFPNNVTFSGANTKVLVGNWTLSGLLSVSSTTVLNRTTSETLSANGFTAAAAISGTAEIILTGGSWSGGGVIQSNMTIAGNVTISGSVAYNTGTLTYSSGTITTTGSTLFISASTTLNTAGISWNNITLNNTATLTINSLLTVTATFFLSGSFAFTFAGSAGFTVGTLSYTTLSVNSCTLANGVTYTVTTALTCFSTRIGSIALFTSDHATNKAILTLQSASAQCNVLASFTRIDASQGRPVITFDGTVTDCLNVYAQTNVAYKPLYSLYRGNKRFELTNRNKAVVYG